MKCHISQVITNNHRNVRGETPDIKAAGSQDLKHDLHLAKCWSPEYPATGAMVSNLSWMDAAATVKEELEYREKRIANLKTAGSDGAVLADTLERMYKAGPELTVENAVILSGGNLRTKFIMPLAIGESAVIDWDLEIPVTERAYRDEESFIAACLHGNEATMSRALQLTLHDRALGISRMPSVLQLDRPDFLRLVGMGGSNAGSQSVLAAYAVGALGRFAGLDLELLGQTGDAGIDPGAVNKTVKDPKSAISMAVGTFYGSLKAFTARVKPEDQPEHVKDAVAHWEKWGVMKYKPADIQAWWNSRTRAAVKLEASESTPKKDELKQAVAGVVAANGNALATNILRAAEEGDVEKLKELATDASTYSTVDNLHRTLSRKLGDEYTAFLTAVDACIAAGVLVTDFTDFAKAALEVAVKPVAEPVKPSNRRKAAVAN